MKNTNEIIKRKLILMRENAQLKLELIDYGNEPMPHKNQYQNLLKIASKEFYWERTEE